MFGGIFGIKQGRVKKKEGLLVMNFQYFNRIHLSSKFDEIQIIGKEIQKEDKCYHIIGMTLKEKKVKFHILEQSQNSFEMENYEEKTPRMSLKNSMKAAKNESFFLHIREVRNGGKIYETAGADSGAIGNNDYVETYEFFARMYVQSIGFFCLLHSLFHKSFFLIHH